MPIVLCGEISVPGLAQGSQSTAGELEASTGLGLTSPAQFEPQGMPSQPCRPHPSNSIFAQISLQFAVLKFETGFPSLPEVSQSTVGEL